MDQWIDLNAIWKIVVFGLLAGAGLPVLFATGMLSLSMGPRTRTAAAGAGGGSGGRDNLVGGSPVGMALAAICFLIVLAAIGWGVYEVYQLGHPSHH